MKEVILEKKDGIVKNLEFDPEIINKYTNSRADDIDPKKRSNVHLCISCQNCYVGKCIKVADRFKKPIDQYDFITEGVQHIRENGLSEEFVIIGCNNYKRDEERKLTSEEKRRAKKIRTALRLDYFNSNSMQEALLTQGRLIASGEIIPNGDISAEEVAIQNAEKAQAREDLDNLKRPWLEKEEIETLGEVFESDGHEAFRSSYEELVDKKHVEAKRKLLKKIENR